MKKYYLKLTALTPIHIGTGEVYEPTNFVIDDGYLYEFDEVLFYKSLNEKEQQEFAKLCQKEDERALYIDIHRFIKANKEIAKKIAHNKVSVTKKIEKDYQKKVANIVQVEGKEKEEVFNKFEIQKTYKTKNYQKALILGSSFKGALSTAYQEMIYKKSNLKELDYKFNKQKIFKNLSISDSIPIKTEETIAYAVNKERFEEDNAQVSNILEVILNESEFITTIDIKELWGDDNKPIKDNVTIEKIKEACNAHYLPLWKNMLREKVNLHKIFIEKYSNLKLNDNQFLIKIGKHSGARAVTIDGLRKILVKIAQIQNKKNEKKLNFKEQIEKRLERLHKKSYFENKDILEFFVENSNLTEKEQAIQRDAYNFLQNPKKLEKKVSKKDRVTINSFLNQETTIWLFNGNNNENLSFGWMLCEIIDKNEYEKLKRNKENYKILKQEIIQNINKELEKQKQIQEEKRKQKEQEEIERQKALKAEQEKLTKMSPLDRKIYELQKNNPNPNETIDIVIYKALKDGEMNEFKCEALKLLRKKMQENGKWNENKPKKKTYKRTMDVMEMLKECN